MRIRGRGARRECGEAEERSDRYYSVTDCVIPRVPPPLTPYHAAMPRHRPLADSWDVTSERVRRWRCVSAPLLLSSGMGTARPGDPLPESTNGSDEQSGLQLVHSSCTVGSQFLRPRATPVPRRANQDKRLLDESYKNRQFIMVGDDAIVLQTRNQLQESEAKTGSSPASVGDWAKFAASVVGLAYPPARIAALGVVVGYEVAKRAIEAWGRVNQSINDNIRLVSLSEAQDIEFPPGHPQIDELYVGHPAAMNRYYPAWDFHRAVFEHKFAEAITFAYGAGRYPH